MTLNLATEEAIRSLEIPHLNKALDTWALASRERIGESLPVVVGNRRKHPALSGYKGLNTQVTLSTLDKTTYLAVWYDPFEIKYAEMVEEMGRTQELIDTIGPMLEAGMDLGPAYDPAGNLEKLDWDMLLRKILLWVLRAKNFKKMANRDNRFAELESLVNSECWTPALNALLADLGYDIAPSLKSVVEDTISGMEGMEEPSRRADRALNALRLWNLLSACGAEDAAPLKKLIHNHFGRIEKMQEEIQAAADKKDMTDPVQVLAFTKEFIRTYRLPGEWEESDEFSLFLNQVGG